MSEVKPMPWREQPWMGPESVALGRWDTHDEAMQTIVAAGGETVLSYEEVGLIYARPRGFIVDDAEVLADPLESPKVTH